MFNVARNPVVQIATGFGYACRPKRSTTDKPHDKGSFQPRLHRYSRPTMMRTLPLLDLLLRHR